MTVGIYIKIELPDVKYTPKDLTEYLKYRSGQSSRIGLTNPLANDKIVDVEYSIGRVPKRGMDKIKKVAFKEIMKAVVKVTGVSESEIISRCRRRDKVLARHLLSYSAYTFTKLSLKEIGRQIKRDHTSIIHGKESIINRISIADEVVINAISDIKDILKIEN